MAKKRQHVYGRVFEQIRRGMSKGCYLEAIALIESVLSDRLESRASYLTGTDYSFKTLERLIKKLGEVETDYVLMKLFASDVLAWKDARNVALHEMAKISVGDRASWTARLQEIKQAATQGLGLLRRVDRRISALRVKNTRRGR